VTVEIAIVFGLLALALALFALEALSVDVVTLLLLLGLMGSGILTPAEAFGGFSNEVIIALASVFVITGALQESGLVDRGVRRITQIVPPGLRGILFGLLPMTAGLSAFMNNTTVAAILVAPVSSLARTAGVPASRLLMPMAFASILGGTCTLVGTSTNLAVSGYMAKHGVGAAGMFEMTAIGLLLVAAGMFYLIFIAPRILPERNNQDLGTAYSMRDYLSEIAVLDGSPLIDESVFKSELAAEGFRVLRILRGTKDVPLRPQTKFNAGDVLLVEGSIEDLMKVTEMAGIEMRPQIKSFANPLDPENTAIAEVIVLPHSELLDQTLRTSRFRQRFDLLVLALSRGGRSLKSKLSDVRLKVGDVLLVQGEPLAIEALRDDPNLTVLQTVHQKRVNLRHGWIVLGLFAVAVIVNAFNVMPLAFCFLGAAVGAVLVRAVTAERAYELIEWRLLILIAGMTAFGTAMDKTGAASLLGKWLSQGLVPLGPYAVLAGLAVLTVLLTQPMSNAAAALVMLPVALEVGVQLGLNARMLSFLIMLSASVSLITPLEPACVLVYSPGRYKFMDFVKCGVPLTALLLVLIVIFCPMIWGMHTAR
jgi:di/tricarboxylate transporter